MHYPEFGTQHLFVGSGVIEAGCKTVVGSCYKQLGTFWTVRGATVVLLCARLTVASRTIGQHAVPLKLHFYVAHQVRCGRRGFRARNCADTANSAFPALCKLFPIGVE